MKRRLRKKDLKKIRELIAQGWTDREIAGKFSVTQAAIIYQRQKMGLPSNCSRQKSGSISHSEIAELLKEDWRCCPIVKEYGVSLEEVNRVSDELFQAGVIL